MGTSVVARSPNRRRATSMIWSRRKSRMRALSSAGELRATSAGTDGARRRERHGEMLHPVDEVRLQTLDGPVHADVGETVEKMLEHHHDLHAGQVGAQAEMRPPSSECHMGI